MELVESPDITESLYPQEQACSCGFCLQKDEAKVLEVRQVFDIKETPIEITEYQKMGITCPACEKEHEGAFPKNSIASTVWRKDNEFNSIIKCKL